MLLKNDIYDTEITSYTAEGAGVCRIDGIPVFVPFAARGDRLTVRILKVHKTYAYGKIEKMISPSPVRSDPPCSVFGKCGGCDIMHLSYEEQLKFKYEKVESAIRRIGKSNAEILPVVPADAVFGYRNKTQTPLAKSDKIHCGFYAKGSHRVIPFDKCLIQKDFSGRLTEIITDFLNEFDISIYDEEKGCGLVRHIYIREGKTETMVLLVLNGNALPHCEALAERLKNAGASSFLININKKKTNVVMGHTTKTVFGNGYITDEMCGLEFEISPSSFYQVNTPQAEKLYNLAAEYADIKSTDTVFDLYCGAGTISLYAAKYAKKVYGIEIVESAVENARKNALLNGIENAEFFCGDAAEITEKLLSDGISADCVIVDPPRKGCDNALLNLLLEINPPKISYVSCNPATLARDINFLEDNGYKCVKVQPVDMFVNSSHVETIVLLQNRNM